MPTNARDATYVAPPSAAATTAVTSTMVRNALSAANRFVCSPTTDMWTPPEWLVLTRTRPSAPALSVAGHDLVTVAGQRCGPVVVAGSDARDGIGRGGWWVVAGDGRASSSADGPRGS